MTSLQSSRLIIIYSIFSFILLYFAYNQAINIHYYAEDAFRYTFGGLKAHCSSDDGFYFMITLGRPLQAYVDCLTFKVGYSFENMQWIRIISVMMLGCCMGLYANLLFNLRFSLLGAFLAAAGLFLLPHFYEFITMPATSLPTSFLFILFAYHCAHNANNETYTLKKQKRLRLLAAAFVALSLLTYPALSFCFASFSLTKLLFSNLSDWIKTRREVIIESSIFIATCTVYFAWAWYNMHYHPKALVPPQYQLQHPNLNVAELFHRLALLGNLFNGLLFGLVIENLQGICWLFLSVVGISFLLSFIRFTRSAFYLESRTVSIKFLIQAIIIGLGLFLLSSAFFLIIPKLELGSRLRFGTYTALYALTVWALLKCSDMLPEISRKMLMPIAFAALVLMEGNIANTTTTDYAHVKQHKIEMVRQQIEDFLTANQKIRRIHYIMPVEEYAYNSFFLTNSALMQVLDRKSYRLTWCSLPRGVTGLEKDHQAEAVQCINHLKSNGIAVTYSLPGERYQVTNDMMVIAYGEPSTSMTL